MQPKLNIEPPFEDGKLEVVIGIFDRHEDASRVAASLRGPDLQVQKISRSDSASPESLPEIVYDEIEEVTSENITNGVLLGGAIGTGSGLLLLALPLVSVGAFAAAAPLAAGIAGAWIGAVAGLDEANRGIDLPGREDYRRMLAEGKSFVVVAGDEAKRAEYGKKMTELGAEEVQQHPPTNQLVRQ
ncbi:MAG: hypothetical protein AB8B55_17730 [Mariniblastus sp.]